MNIIYKEKGNTAADDGGGGDATPKDKKESVGGKKLPYRYGNQKNAVPRQSKFEGKCNELKGHVYKIKVMSIIAQIQDRQTCLSRQQRRWLSLWGGPTSMVATSNWQ